MQTKTIALGGQSFTLTELPLKRNAEWRRLFEEKLEPLFGIIADFKKLEINNADDLQRIISLLRNVVLRAPETLGDLVFAYSPVLKANQAWIEENIYASELLAAVTEVLQLAYPFGSVFSLIKAMNGAAETPGVTTLTNSALPNGPQLEVG